MAHKPIISTQQLSFLFPKITWNRGTIGLLYKNGQFIRSLNSGEQDRNGTLYEIDVLPHSFMKIFSLPSATQSYYFPIKITIEYQVSNARFMVENNIDDTESLVTKALEPELKKKARAIHIEKYDNIPQEIESVVTQKLMSSIGLTMNSSIVDIEYNDYWINTVLPHLSVKQSSHEEMVLTRNSNYSFELKSTVYYRVSESSSLPQSADVAETILWNQQILPQIRVKSKEYGYQELRQAEQGIQEHLGRSKFSDFGIQVVAVRLNYDLDPKAKELLAIEHRKNLDKLEHDVDLARQQFSGDTIKFYQQFVNIDATRAPLIAMMLKKNPEDAQKILEYIDDRERVQVERKLAILQTLVDKGDIWDEKTQVAIQDILDALRGAPTGLQLEAGRPTEISELKSEVDKQPSEQGPQQEKEDVIVIEPSEVDEISENQQPAEQEEPRFKPFDENNG